MEIHPIEGKSIQIGDKTMQEVNVYLDDDEMQEIQEFADRLEVPLEVAMQMILKKAMEKD